MHTLTDPDVSQDWRHSAECRDADPNELQPEVASQEQVDATMARYCLPCPVRLECRQLAESQAGTYGIHAGQWYGDAPRDPAAEQCSWCGGAIAAEDSQTPPLRSTREYCSSRCRVASHRARHAMSA